MKKLHRLLELLIFAQIGIFLVCAAARYLDYVRHPEVYAAQSAPWYTSILLTLALTAVTAGITAAAYFAVGQRLKR